MEARTDPTTPQPCANAALPIVSLRALDAHEPSPKPSFDRIHTEILLLILRHTNLNGNLASLRLTCSRFNEIITHEAPALLNNLQTAYSLAVLLVRPATLPTLIRLQSQLQHLQDCPLPAISHRARASLLLTTYLYHKLTSPAHHSGLTLAAPLATLTSTITTPIPEPYVRAVRTLPLADLDAYIDGLNQCATALWRVIEAHELSALTRHALSLITHDESSSIDLERAICAEIAIWRGVPWCLHFARDVRAGLRSQGGSRDEEPARRYWGSMSAALTARCLLDSAAQTGGGLGKLWQGSATEAIKLASGGLAGWLWRERKARYEQVLEQNGGRAPVGVRPCLGVGVL